MTTAASLVGRTLGSLSTARRQLVRTCQNLGFGRIENLAIRQGEPQSDPPPRVIRDIKFSGENGPRAELKQEDFPLKAQVIDLFHQLDLLQDVHVTSLEVKHGLPFAMKVEETFFRAAG